ncbi:MAG: HEAT repeat domain-containing protein [Carboxylicivirga sp.]|nr:HEAT repeat domain-containing protein [Carboxylicivirga sp.]
MSKLLLTTSLLLFLAVLSYSRNSGRKTSQPKISKEVNRIVRQMAKANVIHSDAIGYGGIKSDQYKRFEKLYAKASIAELLVLMDHPKPAVRGYAFWALAKQHYNDLEKVFLAHANDSQPVDQMVGCIGGEIPLIAFMRWVVMPDMLDLKCKKLNLSNIE